MATKMILNWSSYFFYSAGTHARADSLGDLKAIAIWSAAAVSEAAAALHASDMSLAAPYRTTYR